MTTIAYKDGVLAADTLSTWHDSRDGYVVKIAKRGPILAGGSGSAVHIRRFLDWFKTGMKGECPDMGDPGTDRWGIGTIFQGQRVIEFGPLGPNFSTDEFHTAGSGAEYAAGALSMGATPEQAVRIAMKHDTKTGGDVTVLQADGRRLSDAERLEKFHALQRNGSRWPPPPIDAEIARWQPEAFAGG